eukprot:GHVQ01025051.1.p1 GENE.GHVQ01025051.1~~GHVQ01025051.1.p1  ORF type:complete len:1117 (+),score=205.22 GHVQ01025051.1:537-3887(+)
MEKVEQMTRGTRLVGAVSSEEVQNALLQVYGQMEDLQNEKEMLVNEIVTLRNTMESLQDVHQEELGSRDSYIESIESYKKTTLADVYAQLQTSQREREDAHDEVKVLKSNIQLLQEIHEEELHSRDSHISSLSESHEAELGVNKAKESSSCEKAEKLQSQLAEALTENERLQSEIETEKGNLEREHRRMSDEELTHCKKQIEESFQQIIKDERLSKERLQHQLIEAHDLHRKTLGEEKDKSKKAEQALAEVASQLRDLQECVQRETETVADLKERLGATKEEVEKYRSLVAVHKEETKSAKDTLDNMTRQAAELRRTHELQVGNVKKMYKELSDQMQETKQQLDEAQSSRDTYTELYCSQEAELSQLKAQLTILQRDNCTLATGGKRMQDHLQQEKRSLEERIEALLMRHEEHKSRYVEVEGKRQALQEQLQLLVLEKSCLEDAHACEVAEYKTQIDSHCTARGSQCEENRKQLASVTEAWQEASQQLACVAEELGIEQVCKRQLETQLKERTTAYLAPDSNKHHADTACKNLMLSLMPGDTPNEDSSSILSNITLTDIVHNLWYTLVGELQREMACRCLFWVDWLWAARQGMSSRERSNRLQGTGYFIKLHGTSMFLDVQPLYDNSCFLFASADSRGVFQMVPSCSSPSKELHRSPRLPDGFLSRSRRVQCKDDDAIEDGLPSQVDGSCLTLKELSSTGMLLYSGPSLQYKGSCLTVDKPSNGSGDYVNPQMRFRKEHQTPESVFGNRCRQALVSWRQRIRRILGEPLATANSESTDSENCDVLLHFIACGRTLEGTTLVRIQHAASKHYLFFPTPPPLKPRSCSRIPPACTSTTNTTIVSDPDLYSRSNSAPSPSTTTAAAFPPLTPESSCVPPAVSHWDRGKQPVSGSAEAVHLYDHMKEVSAALGMWQDVAVQDDSPNPVASDNGQDGKKQEEGEEREGTAVVSVERLDDGKTAEALDRVDERDRPVRLEEPEVASVCDDADIQAEEGSEEDIQPESCGLEFHIYTASNTPKRCSSPKAPPSLAETESLTGGSLVACEADASIMELWLPHQLLNWDAREAAKRLFLSLSSGESVDDVNWHGNSGHISSTYRCPCDSLACTAESGWVVIGDNG